MMIRYCVPRLVVKHNRPDRVRGVKKLGGWPTDQGRARFTILFAFCPSEKVNGPRARFVTTIASMSVNGRLSRSTFSRAARSLRSG